MDGSLPRRFGLVRATALNMSNMIGIGPFITIPLLMSALGGPPAMFGWAAALVIALADGMVWSELGAALPGSGGTYRFLREGFGGTLGRLAGFLFICQFVVSGPLEIASGYIGLASYLGYLLPASTGGLRTQLIAVAAGVVNLALLYRPIESLGKITLVLWAGTMVTVLAVIVTGALHFDPAVAFARPRSPLGFSTGFLFGLGAATRIGVYDYLGYSSACYIGDEVKDPGRVIPRSILLSVVSVALLYVGINLSITGVVPWREFVPAEATRPVSTYVVSVFMERTWGRPVAVAFTWMVVWTAFGSVFALLLGYSRVPYAAARAGDFFSVFGRLHPKQFPHVSLLVVGAISIAASFAPLALVIDALITTRIVVQFIGQIAVLTWLRRTQPGLARPYRMWLYPLPSLVALVGWVFLFVTSDVRAIAIGLLTLVAGLAAFYVRALAARRAGPPAG
jgi:amino acid transporter